MKHVIVTGASRGIGLEVIRQFLNGGHRVYCLTRNIAALEGMQQANLRVIATDMLSVESMANAVASIRQDQAVVDIVVHNAGSLVNKPYDTISYEELERVYKVNVFAPYYLTQQLLPVLGVESRAHVINISSMGGFQGSAKFPGLTAYSSSKAAVAGLTECLAEELKERNISVNCLAIGAVQTEMLAEAFPGYVAPLSALQMAEYIYDFALRGHLYYNGKILPVSSTTP